MVSVKDIVLIGGGSLTILGMWTFYAYYRNQPIQKAKRHLKKRLQESENIAAVKYLKENNLWKEQQNNG